MTELEPGTTKLIDRKQASSTVRATPARSSTALASSSRTGVRSPRSAPSSSTTSRPSNKHVISIGAGRSQFRGVIDEASGLFHGRVHNDFIGCLTSFDGWHGSDMGQLRHGHLTHGSKKEIEYRASTVLRQTCSPMLCCASRVSAC